eukprot:7388076-Prymnesium_polylepis.1
MSQRISDGVISPGSAVAQLSEADVKVSKSKLTHAAKVAPGKSPIVAGAKPWLPHEMQQDLYDDIAMLRAHNLPCTQSTVLATARSLVRGTVLEEKWEDYDEMLTEHWFRDFCAAWDLSTDNLKPLDDVRSAWETSANAEKQYQVWADLALSTKPPCAVRNPDFDPNKPYDQPIFWTEDGLVMLTGMDETDVRGDQSKRGKSPEMRSCTVNEFGSTGRGKGRGRGRHGTRGGRGKKKADLEGEAVKVDDKSAVSLKGGSKITFAGGSKGNGAGLPPQIISNKSLTEDMVKNSPQGTVLDYREDPPVRMAAEYSVTKSGGMEWEANIAYLENIIQPATGSKKGEREGIHGVDGFGSHINIRVVRKAVELGQHIALRFPHGSRRIQGQDTDNFPIFSRAFEKAKSEKQVSKFREARAKAASEDPPRKPTAQEIYDASTLTEGEWLECAVEPWEKAFDPEVNRRAWRHEGGGSEKRGCAGQLFGVILQGFWLHQGAGGVGVNLNTSAASSSLELTTRAEDEDDVDLSSEGMNADAEAELEAEQRDGPKAKKPRVSSADLFKLKGSATGKMALQIIRQKEVERRAAELKKAANKDKRSEKTSEQRRTDLLNSSKLVEDLTQSPDPKAELVKVNKPELSSLLRIYGIQPPQGKNWSTWSKPEVLTAVRDLLRSGKVGSPEQQSQLTAAAQVTLALTMAPTAVGEGSLALTSS